MKSAKKPNVPIITVLVITVIALTVTVVFTALELDHDCCGADCPVCLMVSFFRHVAHAVLWTVGCLVCLRAVSFVKKPVLFFFDTISPVRLKIKLSR